MSRPNNDYDGNVNVASGNSLDLDVNYCESEIRADVVVSEYNSVRLWGRIVNCKGKPVPNALVKLLKVEYDGKYVSYKGIAHTVSDCEGFYQFELCGSEEDHRDNCYKIVVSKAAYGQERVIHSNGNCDPCDPCEPEPCKEYPPIVQEGYDVDYSSGYNPYGQKQKPRY